MSATICSNCGAQVAEASRFCQGCGTSKPGVVRSSAKMPSDNKTIVGGPPSMMGVSGEMEAPKTAKESPPPVMQTPVKSQSTEGDPALSRTQALEAPTPEAAMPSSSDGYASGQMVANRYRIERRIGEGGFGTVYEARQTQMDRVVALKVLHADLAKDEKVLSRFRREAQACSQLRAAHTVKVYDFDQTQEGIPFLAMEKLEGISLEEALAKDGRFSPVRLAKVLKGIAESLGEAHTLGIVHRDVKPENIFIEPRPTPDFVKVLDFGIAKIFDKSGPALTAVGQTLGTLEYMSPEQLMGKDLDGRSDLYALGLLGYELLTGGRTFAVKTPGDLIGAQLKSMPPLPSERVGSQDPLLKMLDPIIMRLIDKNRDLRYPTCADLCVDLDRVIARERGASQPTAISSREPAAQNSKPQNAMHDKDVELSREISLPPNRTPQLIAIGIGCAVIISALLWFFLHH